MSTDDGPADDAAGDGAVDVDVLIVGAGPVGLLGGILASRHGLSALVIERRDGPQTAPAAHVVNARTYEICRQIGLDMERIHAAGKDPADAGHVNFLTSLTGDLVGRLPFERQGEDCLDITPTPLRNLSQHRFEPILVDELGAAEGAELRYGQQWQSSTVDSDGVTSVVTDLATGTDVEVRSRYVIGCDGAGSRVRTSLGIEMQGPPLIQCFVMIHFAADLRALVAHRLGVLHFVLDPEAEGVFVAHDIDREWVFMQPMDESAESVDDFDDERCLAAIRRSAGCDIDAEILGRSTWWMSAQHADSMGEGRMFLAGDSAHRFPPTGGLGLNSGVADVHAVLWRIAAIEAGWATPPVLDTYAVERLPVAQVNAHESLTNAVKIAHLAEALGTDVEPTTERMHASLADPAKADEIAEAVRIQSDHFDLLGLQIGYVYEMGSLLSDGEPPAPFDPHDYAPTGHPGARLPHAWLDGRGGRSTLDLVARSAPTLFTFGEHDAWADAVEAWPHIEQVRVGVDTPALEEWRNVCGVSATGALLVRPDQHIAWRAADETIDQLEAAVAALSGGM